VGAAGTSQSKTTWLQVPTAFLSGKTTCCEIEKLDQVTAAGAKQGRLLVGNTRSFLVCACASGGLDEDSFPASAG
jgi:hypothetical protein